MVIKLKLSKKSKLAIGLLIASVIAVSLGAAFASFVLSGTVSWPNPLPQPTDTFTVTATMNGTVQSTPLNINLAGPIYQGDSYVIVYSITSTANQPLTVSETNSITGATASWDKTSVTLAANGNTATMTLTVSPTSAGQIVTSFAANM